MHMKKKAPNLLINKTFPFLLQHTYNPVKWYAWTDRVFTKTKEEYKPVFLSISFSNCCRCHIMAYESFENDCTASIINESFSPVKVNREKQPDIDPVCISVRRFLTGSGSWPLIIIITQNNKPFFAGAYFPSRP